MARKNTKKTTKKKVIDKYDPQIYPRQLWVSKNVTMSDVCKRFSNRDDSELDKSWDPTEGTFTLCVKDKQTGKYGLLVNFADWALGDKSQLVNYVTHEAEHVKSSIFDDIGLITNPDSQEADAYLIGWIAQCIYETVTK